MNKFSPQEFLSSLDRFIIEFENEKDNQKLSDRSLGAIYTPKPLVDFIVFNILKKYLDQFFILPKTRNAELFFKELKTLSSKNNNLKYNLIDKLSSIKILDPACGSGRFLLSIANILYKFLKFLKPHQNEFALKETIIQNNLYGIEIDRSAFLISKLRLFYWLYFEHLPNLTFPKLISDSNNLEEINKIIQTNGFKFNLFNLDFLLEFNSKKYDIIVGNPPYVENKKIKNIEFKKQLTRKFKSAYRLFDLSIIFIERSIELLKEQEGFLSMITINKFLAADYGIKIRKLLLYNTELKEIINISSLPIFGRTAVYPIIISFKKSTPNKNNLITIKYYQSFKDLNKDSPIKSHSIAQKSIRNLPSQVIPISGQIDLINYLYKNFKPFSETINDLNIIYRPYGFINWSKHLNNISDKLTSKKDFILIGTGNVGKYFIKFDKSITIAKRSFPLSYFKYKSEFEDIWKEFSSPKLIFREIAKELTWIYDSGIYTNVTGLYFVKIPNFDQDRLFSLLAIMNSKLMDLIFKTLFSSLHMSGGYLRFNGSFIKRLPIPQNLPSILSYFGKTLQFLSQLQYDLRSNSKYNRTQIQNLKKKFQDEVTSLLHTSNKITNSLVNLLYLDNLCLKSNKDFYELREFLNSENIDRRFQIKYLLPRFELDKYNLYSIEELELVLNEIRDFIKKILENTELLRQIDEIMKFPTHYTD